MARICARCRQPVARREDHVCLDDDLDEPESDGAEENEGE